MLTVAQEPVVPERVRALGGVDRVDYVDLFVAATEAAVPATPDQLAREAVEGASALGRFLAWRLVCRLRLDAEASSESVGGWRVDGRGPAWVRLAASSGFMTANMVFVVEERRASFATFIRYDRPVAAVLWGLASVAHRAVAPAFLGGAVKRLHAVERPASRNTEGGGPL